MNSSDEDSGDAQDTSADKLGSGSEEESSDDNDDET